LNEVRKWREIGIRRRAKKYDKRQDPVEEHEQFFFLQMGMNEKF
jgi:hypothetical protein